MDEGLGSALYGQEEIEKEERVKKLTPLAKDVVMVLVKTIKATKMYLPNNPIYQKFREELRERLDVYFEYEEYLSFLVNRFELAFLDQQVYYNPDKEDNIALMFFKDGIREFCFHKGVTPEEIDAFIEILKFDQAGHELDDDLVTLMWEKDFQNITYTLADEATAEESEEEEALLSFEEEPEAIRQLDELRERASRDSAVRGGGIGVSPGVGSGLPAMSAGNEEDDYMLIRGTFKPPDDLSLLTELTDIFYEILLTETEREHFEMVAGTLSKALEMLVQRGELSLATILVMRVQELMADPRLAGWSDELDKIIDKAASRELVKKVGEYIDQGGIEAMESAGSYLAQLDSRAVGQTVELLETLEDRKSRKAICDILGAQTGGNGKLLVPFLGHRYWYVVRNVVMILGKVADPDTMEALGGVLGSSDARLRREALYALASIKGDKAEEFIGRAISSSDRGTTALAARLLVDMAPEKAYARLLEVVSGKGFQNREFDEKKEVFELLGRAGGEKAVPYFAQQFKLKGFWKSAKRDKARAAAAYGLAAAGGQEANDLLQSGTDSKSQIIRTACLDGLKKMKR